MPDKFPLLCRTDIDQNGRPLPEQFPGLGRFYPASERQSFLGRLLTGCFEHGQRIAVRCTELGNIGQRTLFFDSGKLCH